MQLFRLAFLLHLLTLTSATLTYLNLTAISASNGASTLECWQLLAPFVVSTQAGTAGAATAQLGNVANSSFSVIPAKFDGGAHRAPAVQYVAFMSGLAHITLPTSKDEVYVKGGKYGLIIAADTAAISTLGHNTTYPTTEETIALQIPTAGGVVPAHKVLHGGACSMSEMVLKTKTGGDNEENGEHDKKHD